MKRRGGTLPGPSKTPTARPNEERVEKAGWPLQVQALAHRPVIIFIKLPTLVRPLQVMQALTQAIIPKFPPRCLRMGRRRLQAHHLHRCPLPRAGRGRRHRTHQQLMCPLPRAGRGRRHRAPQQLMCPLPRAGRGRRLLRLQQPRAGRRLRAHHRRLVPDINFLKLPPRATSVPRVTGLRTLHQYTNAGRR